QAFKPGVYARAVKMVLEAGSCPKIENGLGESGTQRLKARPFELTAVSFMTIGAEKSAVPWLVRLYLRDEKGNLVDQRAVDPRDGIWEGTERDTCLAQTEVQGASLRVTVECERAGGVPGPRVRREEFEYRISAGKIEWVSKPH
ncbi:MAG: hypothetical protein JXB05_14425, partial [Myxococcaceae bacterium]|nr:hypothetical protein [Myxococcaceae bacterium]